MSTAELQIPPASPAPAAAQAQRAGGFSITRRAGLLVFAYILVTGGLLAGLLWQLRGEAIQAAKRELGAFAQLTAGHTYEVAIGLEEALKLTEVTLTVATEGGAADQDSIRAMLVDVAKNSRGLKDILVLDAKGHVAYQASGKTDIGADWSARPYVARFQKDKALQFGFGVPFRHAVPGGAEDWVIPVWHAWRKADGEFMGLIVGIMDRQFFDKAWTFDSEIEGLSIALIASDGSVIMRRPLDEKLMGRSVADPDILNALARNRPSDALQIASPFDNVARLVAYRRVAAYPELAIFVTQPVPIVLASWWRVAWVVGLTWVAASLALALLGLWLRREMKARSAVESRYQALFNAIPYPVLVSDFETQKILAYNQAATLQYAWSGDEALSADFAELANRRQELSDTSDTFIPDQRHHNKAGGMIDVELTARRIDYNGRRAILTVAVDVSDRLKAERARRAAEEQLRQAQKMDVLGQLTGGIAHDFNNILMVIIDNVEELAEKEGVETDTRKTLSRIGDAAQRAEDLTRQMLAFSRKQPLRPRSTNVNDLVHDTGRLLRRTLGEQVEIDSVLADDLWSVEVDPAQLESALVNLCLNARDAMPAGGHVLIQTENVSIGKDEAAREPGMPVGDAVRITVSDTGHGIPAADLEKIFEPFFSTKGAGKGSGLGLSTVYGFIRQSSGHIGVVSEIDRGAAFRITLPRRLAQVSDPPARPPAAMTGGTERVLVVEDDPLVRASVVRQLQSLGYVVSQAADGAAGLATFQAAPQPFDLLLTDVVMPGMNGKALADAVAARWPGTKIVFMSGYTDNVLSQRGEIDAGVRLLNKPFRKSDLAAMLRQTLDGA
ncbi:MAG TPA: ATP-binding protein [Reyranella sp.]|nr:ATP-binding protein [Reyranella sp.]